MPAPMAGRFLVELRAVADLLADRAKLITAANALVAVEVGHTKGKVVIHVS